MAKENVKRFKLAFTLHPYLITNLRGAFMQKLFQLIHPTFYWNGKQKAAKKKQLQHGMRKAHSVNKLWLGPGENQSK